MMMMMMMTLSILLLSHHFLFLFLSLLLLPLLLLPYHNHHHHHNYSILFYSNSILIDHPLEDRNTIEMQSITAMAHLHSTILYFIDISQQCGYSLQQQVQLYHNIRPLFNNKPVLIVANKSDVVS